MQMQRILQYNETISKKQEDNRMKFRPLHDWVLIKRSKPVEMTGGGIIIPDAAKDKPAEGTVEAVGPGRYKQEKGKKDKKFFPTVLKPGQKVMFIDYMAKDVELDGTEITLIREDDVLGIIENRGDLTVKKAYHVEIKKDRPPMVQAQPEKKAESAVGVKQPAKTKKEKQAGAAVKKTAAHAPKKGKEGALKKTVKEAGPKKTAPKKGVKKAAAKKAAAKKVAPRKTAKKAASKKVAPKKTTKKATKKAKK